MTTPAAGHIKNQTITRNSTTAAPSLRRENLRAVVEVVPVVAGAHPVVIGGSVVGLVVGVSGGVVELAGLGVLAGGLGVEGGCGLTVKSLLRRRALVLVSCTVSCARSPFQVSSCCSNSRVKCAPSACQAAVARQPAETIAKLSCSG